MGALQAICFEQGACADTQGFSNIPSGDYMAGIIVLDAVLFSEFCFHYLAIESTPGRFSG